MKKHFTSRVLPENKSKGTLKLLIQIAIFMPTRWFYGKRAFRSPKCKL